MLQCSWHGSGQGTLAFVGCSARTQLSTLLLQPDEYEKLGSYALIGLPDDLYPTRYVEVGIRMSFAAPSPAA
jgi:hypothetical protein